MASSGAKSSATVDDGKDNVEDPLEIFDLVEILGEGDAAGLLQETQLIMHLQARTVSFIAELTDETKRTLRSR